MLKFKFLSGDVNWSDYGGMFVSKKLNNGDFDYWLVINVVNMDDACGDVSDGRYMVDLLAVSPEQNQDTVNKLATDDYGMDLDQVDNLMKVEMLASYGVYASLWSGMGNNINELMKEARKEAQTAESLFGFFMDKPQNRIGSNGWDMIKGDVLAGIR